jgi:predicted DNA-binding protein (UPF0251 family)
MIAQRIEINGSLELNSHYDTLHNSPHGAVVVWERLALGRRWTKIEPYHPVAALLGPYAGKQDVFITVNEFWHWRLIRNLKSLRACYVDIDHYTDWEMALEALREAKIPAPSFMVLSGRGLHFYWLLAPLPAQALPTWQRIQDALVDALAHLGADYRAKDCTRLLRLAGTVNSKNGAEVIGRTLTRDIWTLHELADEVLGPRIIQTATVFDLKAHAARRRRKSHSPAKGSIYAWWHIVYKDLCAIAGHHWLGGIPEGRRDAFLFLMANSLSWFACPDALETEIVKTAKTFTPSLTTRQVETYTKPILKRAKEAAEGKKYTWEGKEVDPRYAFRAETMRGWLGGQELIPPELWPELRALAPRKVIHERRQEREKVRDRVTEGRYQRKREEFLNVADERRTEALRLRAEGLSWNEVGERMGISTNAAKLLGSRAKK